MKVVMLSICFFVTVFCNRFFQKIIALDNIILSLYKNNFYQFLTFDGEYNLMIDKEKLRKYLSLKGYDVEFCDNADYKFKIKINYVITVDKEYYFYLVKNNEQK